MSSAWKTAMAGPERHARALLLVLVTGAAAGCAGPPAPEPVTRAEQPPSPPPTPAEASPQPTPEPAAPAETSEEPRGRDGKLVVVDPGEAPEGGTKSLVEAARAERERRARSGPPVAVITDKNLAQYAKKGQITIADPKDSRKKVGEAAPAAAEPGQPVRDEKYWRDRALDIRQRWRRAADEVKDLEQSAAELRQRFYAEEDVYVRDTQVKPEWDRVLERLEARRAEVDTTKRELAEFLEEGRRADALPGWLREGAELEPAPEEPKKQTVPHQSIEPPVLDDHGDEGGA